MIIKDSYIKMKLFQKLEKEQKLSIMFSNHDVAGKLELIGRMKLLAGILLVGELLSIGWVLIFYFLYSGQEVGNLSVSWLLFIGMMVPFNWPGAVVCAISSLFLPTNAVIILTAGALIILVLLVNWAVWDPDPQHYNFLVKGMRLEMIKSVLFMLAGCFIALVDTNGRDDIIYMAVAVYEAGSAINIIIFNKFIMVLDRMDYREVFQTDGKKPYGQ